MGVEIFLGVVGFFWEYFLIFVGIVRFSYERSLNNLPLDRVSGVKKEIKHWLKAEQDKFYDYEVTNT